MALRPREKRQFRTTCRGVVSEIESGPLRNIFWGVRGTVMSFSSYRSTVSNSSCSGTCGSKYYRYCHCRAAAAADIICTATITTTTQPYLEQISASLQKLINILHLHKRVRTLRHVRNAARLQAIGQGAKHLPAEWRELAFR